jgi:MFS family permease
MKLPEALAPLRHRDFRILWIGQALSLVGTWMEHMAVGWVVTGFSDDALHLGLLQVVGAAPVALLSLSAGALADRGDKRRILMVTQVAMMLLSLAFASLVMSERLTLGHVFVLAALLGVATAYSLPASQALPPQLVEPPQIGKAVAMMQQIFHGARLIGPAIAGALMARFGLASPFVANAVSFGAVIFSLWLVKTPPRRGSGDGVDRGIAGGIDYVRRDRLVGPLIVLAAITCAFVFPFVVALMVFYVRHVLAISDPNAMGFLMSGSGLGSLVGTILLFWGTGPARRYTMVGSVVGCCAMLVALAARPAALTTVALVVAFLSLNVSSLMGRISQAIQERVPDQLRGRVMGIFAMAFVGVMPPMALLWGLLCDVFGYVPVIRVSALAFLVLGVGLMVKAWPGFASAAPNDSAEPATRDR